MSIKRKDPGTPPSVRKDEKPGFITEFRKYKVITPLYGGGEKPGKPDSVTIVRATEVRGHLRFWWRATRGGTFDGSLEKMRKREEQIWGSSEEKEKTGPSKVTVNIGNWNPGQSKTYDEKLDKRGNKVHIAQPGAKWSYVSFPLREDKGSVYENVSFELEIKYPIDFKDEVEAALWAWETFGGIGARTRRGFGSLQQDGVVLSSRGEAKSKIKIGLQKYVVIGKWPHGVPHLSNNLRFETPIKNDAMSAWQDLFGKLKNFRQDRPPGATSPGRSKWPEPDEIRRLVNSKHKFHLPTHPVNKFPRAKFGLPIIFQFKDKKDGDPEQTSLEGKDHDRLASPLILRPIQCSDGAVGLAAILEWDTVNINESYTPPGGLILKGAPGDPKVKSDLNQQETAQIPLLNGNSDILQAFLNTLK